MQQILAVLSGDGDAASLAATAGDGLRAFLAPNVVLVDGDQAMCDALKGLKGVLGVLSDDDAKTATAASDMTAMDVGSMASLVSTALGLSVTLDEPAVMAISGWMFGQSDQYASWISDRPRDGEAWDGACVSNDEPNANA